MIDLVGHILADSAATVVAVVVEVGLAVDIAGAGIAVVDALVVVVVAAVVVVHSGYLAMSLHNNSVEEQVRAVLAEYAQYVDVAVDVVVGELQQVPGAFVDSKAAGNTVAVEVVVEFVLAVGVVEPADKTGSFVVVENVHTCFFLRIAAGTICIVLVVDDYFYVAGP